jgi:hypothetical protein
MKIMMKCLIALLAITIPYAIGPDSAGGTTLNFQPTPSNLYDLDHHSLYTWRIDNVNLTGQTITSATLTFQNIRNWDGNPNQLFIHLLDTAKNGGVATFIDDPTGSAPVTDITDDFANPRYHGDPNWLVATGTADTFLASPTFTTNGTNFVLTLTNPQLGVLASYFNNGNNVALGLDPDCHFFNDQITFTVNTTPVPMPEPASMMLLGTGLVGLFFARRRFARQVTSRT